MKEKDYRRGLYYNPRLDSTLRPRRAKNGSWYVKLRNGQTRFIKKTRSRR
jgi:hypothetical protein